MQFDDVFVVTLGHDTDLLIDIFQHSIVDFIRRQIDLLHGHEFLGAGMLTEIHFGKRP